MDQWAIALSGVCFIHCVAIPVALIAAPALGTHLLGSETATHWLLLGVAVPVSGVALAMGYRRHGQGMTMLIGIAGLAVMFLGVSHLFGRGVEVPITLLGVALVAAAHVLNARQALAR